MMTGFEPGSSGLGSNRAVDCATSELNWTIVVVKLSACLPFISDDPSLNPADAYSFFMYNFCSKELNKQKEALVGPFFKKTSEINFINFWHAFNFLLKSHKT